MAKTITKIIIKSVLILCLLAALVSGTIFFVWRGFVQGEISKRINYRVESSLIEDALKELVKVGCSQKSGNQTYCDSSVTFKVAAVEPRPQILYATGIVKTSKNQELGWVASKTDGVWHTLYIEDANKPIPNCSDVSDFPPDIFNQKLRYCMNNGQKVDRVP